MVRNTYVGIPYWKEASATYGWYGGVAGRRLVLPNTSNPK